MSLIIKVVNCPSNKIAYKCPYAMTPEGICIHNTANDASAMNEISYMLSNWNYCSYHYAVDDTCAIQGIPLNRNAFHAGDGATGRGNRKMISIEICFSRGGGKRFIDAERNAAELAAKLLKQYSWGVDRVFKHQDFSGKYCPHRTLDMGWERFLNMVQVELNKLNGVKPVPQPQPSNRKVGDVVTINGVYTSSTSGQKLTPAKTTGTITKIVSAPNPYLLDNGNLGWVNESCIVGAKPVVKPQPAPTPKPQTTGRKIGDVVNINGVYTSSSSTQKLNPAVKTGTITQIVHGAKNPYLLNNGNIGWVNDSCIVGAKPQATPKPQAPSIIRTGARVVVTNPYDTRGTHLAVSGVYDVMEGQDRHNGYIVIARNGVVIAAISPKNVKLA